MPNIYEQVDVNKRKSALVIMGFVLFIILAAYTMSRAFDLGMQFVSIAIIVAGIGSFLSYYYSDQIILTLSNAKPATREEFFNFYTVTQNLTMSAQLPMPRLYVIEDSAMNAFATGRDPQHSVICATTGILTRLDRTELEGVIAHELSHIKNYDIRLMSIVTILVGMITLLSDWLLRATWFGGRKSKSNNGDLGAIIAIVGLCLALLSPLFSNLIKLAISRRREFLADASGAVITKYPEGLARALEKISTDAEPLEIANKATAHLFFTNPFHLDSPDNSPGHKHGSIGWFSNLFNTHPPIYERIAALRS
jgi:heat shock protein HtpX